MGSCAENQENLPVSAVNGNIGVVRCKAVVWEHDPLCLRPHQQKTFPFTQHLLRDKKTLFANIRIENNALLLAEQFSPQDMFVCTIHKPTRPYANMNPDSMSYVNEDVDIYGSLGTIVQSAVSARMPGGSVYEKEPPPDEHPWVGKRMFPHQMWVHIGSLLDPRVLVHPSEWIDPNFDKLAKRWNPSDIDLRHKDPFDKTLPPSRIDLQNAARFDYAPHPSDGHVSYWPKQSSKSIAGSFVPVHWTLEKYNPVWQGQDFYFAMKTEDKNLDEATDPNPTTLETVSLRDPSYDYLSYNIFSRSNSLDDTSAEWINGLSNEAYYMPNLLEADADTVKNVRRAFDWRYLPYVLIEIGPHQDNFGFGGDHHYFIEFVRGRKPRFLHLGYEWDDVNRAVTDGQSQIIPKDKPGASWRMVKKCRALSTFESVSSDKLLASPGFEFSLRHHLGDVVITFKGYEGQPWLIRRQDNRKDRFDFDAKEKKPVMVPHDVIRIHVGNISCRVNYSVMTYHTRGFMLLPEHDFETYAATDHDIFMTCSRMGINKNWKLRLPATYKTSSLTKQEKKSEFAFPGGKRGTPKCDYDADAFYAKEIIENSKKTINLYKWLRPKYEEVGRGWYYKQSGSSGTYNLVNGQGGATGRGTSSSLASLVELFNYDKAKREKLAGASGPELPDIEGTTMPLYHVSGTKRIDTMARWWVGVNLFAGGIELDYTGRTFYTNMGVVNTQGHPAPIYTTRTPEIDTRLPGAVCTFQNCITPIVRSVRAIVLSGGKPFAGKTSATPFDIAPLIETVGDNWTSDSATLLNHEVQIKCIIPRGTPVGPPANQGFNNGQTDQQISNNLYAMAQRLKSMQDKTIWVTLRYWWDTGIGKRVPPNNTYYSGHMTPENDDLLIQMTGVAHGAELEVSNNKLYMTFTVKDYMQLMRNQLIFNSPFFDGVRDIHALYELGRMASLDDYPNIGTRGIDRNPMGYLRTRIDNDTDKPFRYNGELTSSMSFDLPGSYGTLAEAKIRFQDGQNFESAFRTIAERSGKVVYFDRWGILRLEDNPAKVIAFQMEGSNSDTPERRAIHDALYKEYIKPKMLFYTSPLDFESGVLGAETYGFDPDSDAAHLVYNVVRNKKEVDSVSSRISLGTAATEMTINGVKTGLGGLIYKGHTFYDLIDDPSAEGFLGYRKVFWQQEGAFGDYDTIVKALKHYSKMRYPPITTSFETYGVPGLKPLDIVALDNQLFYITEITHDIEADTNRWWMSISGKWLKQSMSELDVILPDVYGKQSGPSGSGGSGGNRDKF